MSNLKASPRRFGFSKKVQVLNLEIEKFKKAQITIPSTKANKPINKKPTKVSNRKEKLGCKCNKKPKGKRHANEVGGLAKCKNKQK